jgi:peroxiredoxin
MHRPGFRALAAIALLAAFAAPARALELGDPAPAFSAPGLTGGTITLSAYRGKVVYLEFWASWCAPCAKSLPALDALRKEFAPGDFQIVAVNLDRNPAVAARFLKERPVGYPSAIDPKGSLPAAFGVEAMPTSFLIDRDGVVRHVHRGFRETDVDPLRREIQKLVAAR